MSLKHSRAINNVIAERNRQIGMEGWTLEHDDQHTNGEMALAAVCYATPIGLFVREMERSGGSGRARFTYRDPWPWDAKWWKPRDRRRDLVRAAALLIAEIERIDRAASKEPGR